MGEPERLSAFAKTVRSTCIDACQLIDVVRQDWQQAGCWSEWDQGVRDRLTGVLIECAKIIDPEALAELRNMSAALTQKQGD